MEKNGEINAAAQPVLVFAERKLLENDVLISEIKSHYPKARVVASSTAGEICKNNVDENTASCVAMHFEKTPTEYAIKNIHDFKNSFELGKALAASLKQKNLKYALLISDGNLINGDDLMGGIGEIVEPSVLISGGLAGDADRFEKTIVGLDGDLKEGNVILIGFYGDHILVGSSAQGGWDVYGPERIITRSDNNVLYEIDGNNALDIYKKYLGKYAQELPSSALLFPISIKKKNQHSYLVRTILSIDEKNKTMRFAGNVPEGAEIRFMKSNFDRLINAASEAGAQAAKSIGKHPIDFALLVSCVGRKIVLADRIDEEVEAVKDQMSAHTTVAGFFSYGEVSTVSHDKFSHLHNQTMTVTTFAELP